LMSGMVVAWDGPGANAVSAVLLGVVLAAYLWLHAGVRAPARLAAVVLAAIFGHYFTILVGLAGLLLLAFQVPSLHAELTPTFAMVPAAAAGAALIAVVFLRVLPSPRDHLGLEIACCA